MNWLVIGAGVSGLGAAKLLRKQGNRVRVSDNRTLTPEKADHFLALGAELKDGGHNASHLDQIDRIVASPGLPSTHPLLVAAQHRQIPVISEIDLALQGFSGRLIAVTGTNGKSTTCAMLHHMLKAAGRKSSLGGNFGDPPTAMLADGRMQELLILELSSYQLEQSELVSPVAAVFTSFSHDHMARHGSLAGYLAAKWKVFAHMQAGSVAVLPSYVMDAAEKQGLTLSASTALFFKDTSEMQRRGTPGFALEAGVAHFSDGHSLALEKAGIKEVHNQLNAGYAMLALRKILNCRVDDMLPLLKGFHGLPHRCEPVGNVLGLPVIDDSKSTNVESTLVALASSAAPVILMMGGQGKKEPYEPLLEAQDKIAALVTFGASGDEIADSVDKELTVYRYPTLKAAMQGLGEIFAKHRAGILFSPGCASFDEFQNYEERGRYFASQAKKALPDMS